MMPATSAKFVGGESFKSCAPERIDNMEFDAVFEVDKEIFGGNYELFPDSWRTEVLNILFMLLRSGGNLN